MADRYCRHCGLEFAGDGMACPRCDAPRDGATIALFDPATGVPVDAERPPPLRCWHCGQPIEQQQLICSHCSIPLTRRSAGAIAYDVVPKSAAPPPPTQAPVQTTPAAQAVLASAADGPSHRWWDDGGEGQPPAAQSAGAEGEGEQPRRNYFIRHWRGDLPLPTAFWINVILVNMILGIATFVIVLDWGPIFNPYLSLAAIAGVIAVAVGIAAWQIVGTWRSALRRFRQPGWSRASRFWAGAAQFWTLLLGLRAVASVVGAWPVVADTVEMGFLGDPSIPDYEIITLPDGSGVVVQGGFKYGVAGALRAALDDAPNATVVYLHSDGGRMAAAAQTYDLIKARGLDTYVVGVCQSACTLAFVAGANRTTGAVGALGFHQAYLEGADQSEVDMGLETFARRYRAAGVSQQFLDRTRTVSPDAMWYPTPSQLYSAGVITRTPDESIRPASMPFTLFGPMVSDLLNVGLPQEIAEGWRILEVDFAADSVTYVTEIDINVIGADRLADAIADPVGFCTPGTLDMIRDDATEHYIFRGLAGDLLGEVILTADLCRVAGAAP